MNAPVLAGVRLATTHGTHPEWRRVAPPLTLGLILLGALFNTEVQAAIQTWTVSTAYNHCFLIIPIALYLLWDRRSDLTGLTAQPTPVALLSAIPLAVIWLAAERLGIMEGRQLAMVSFVQLLFLAVLGKRLWWAMAGPLLYLYFLVPFGEFLTPRLQDITTWFIRHGLEILGIPAYIDGYVIEIPQGTFFVAEACAGLRFLIASIAFGCLYALMMYRSPLRRGTFILASIIVPIVANGFRGTGIVYLGYLLGSAQAAAADHLIYGWIFFSAVILILIALGLPFRQDEIPLHRPSPTASSPAGPVRSMLILATALALLAAVTPAIATTVAWHTATTVSVPASIAAEPGCAITPLPSDLPNLRTQRIACGGVPMDMTWAAFSPRITAAPLMAERRRLVSRAMTEGLSENWLESGDAPSAWRLMRSNDPAYITAVAIWVDGIPVRPGLSMRMRMAINSLFGSTHAPMVVSVTPAVEWDTLSLAERTKVEASLSAFLQSYPALDQTIGSLTTLP